MKRFKVLFGNRRMMVLLTLAVLVLAATALIASSASFTSTSSNPGNIFTAGNLKHTNTGALLTVSKIKPDNAWVNEGTVTIANDGDIASSFTMTSAITADVADPTDVLHNGHLSGVLNLRVHAASQLDPNVFVYDGPLNAITNHAMGTIASGASETYTFTVQFPNGGVPGGAYAGDNLYKGTSTTVRFDWTGINL